MTADPATAFYLLRNHLSRSAQYEFVPEFLSLVVQASEGAFVVACFVLLESLGHVGLAVLEQSIDKARELVGHGGDGLGGAKSGAQAAVFGSESALAVVKRL